jgi:hypothetical protein
MMSIFSVRCKKTPQLILHSQAQEYAVVIPTKYNYPHSWANCVDSFIWHVKQTDMMHMVSARSIVGPAHLVAENSASHRIDSIWDVNNLVDFDTYWTIY